MIADGRTDFDFLAGEWDVTNRALERRAPEEAPVWREFPSKAISRPILGGLGNIDEYHFPEFPGRGEYRGFALRLFDPETGKWRIWWASNPGSGDLEPPVAGRFRAGEGRFEGDDSFDGRRSFAVNWIMSFRRAGTERQNGARS